ncbi:hypothetical protein FACS1894170_01770 [Planctomycetales bacterium]|nr:hypothetical protein FACS1894170_01770 [Planctomycetales bacterium]
MTITNNDPKLTAFVLGELTDDEAKEIQSVIDADAELKAEVEAIRQTVAQIETVMHNEPLPGKIGIVPKRKKWFIRIAAGLSTVAALLLIVGIVGVVNTPQVPFRENFVAVNIFEGAKILDEADTSSPPLSGTVEKAAKEAQERYSEASGVVPVIASDSKTNAKAKILSSSSLMEHSATEPARKEKPIPSGETYSEGCSAMQPARIDDPFYAAPSVRGMPKVPAPQANARQYSLEKSVEVGIMPIIPPRERDNDRFNSANDEAYKNYIENDFKPVKVGEFSTFSIDVDTASYTTMRRFVESGQKPPVDSVRLEEYINYFKYDYAAPTDGKPFATHVDVSTCPWEPKHLLARVGIKGKEYSVDERPPLNLVFLIDVSGSMSSSNRLPLVQRGLTELVEMLQTKDRVAIVTYAGESRVALPSISGQEKRAILDSINSLGAGGSTAGAAGIKTAYETARKYYDKQAQNRVILCTDGDFNVGETNNKTLEEMIGDEAKSGVFLTILGFGMGNYKDDRLKTLSMRGNGNYGYIDNIEEARRLLVEGLTGTLFAIAKDVKIQVDFNPAKVAGYRLLGYENRKLRDEDFHNDKVDAGEIGAGHTVTALYEIVPAGESVPAAVDKSRYDNKEPEAATPVKEAKETDELMFVKVRYKLPDADKSSLLEYPVKNTVSDISGDSQFAASVALYGMLLIHSRHSGNGNFDSVLELATPNTKDDKYRTEFVELVKKAAEKN